jgi:hypothetical protein
MAIESASYSKLGDFEKCKFYAYLKHDQRIPEPQRPLKPGQTEQANDRGTRYHTNCEEYVLGKTDELLPDINAAFGPELDLMRVLHEDGMVSLEGQWGYDLDWNVTDWFKARIRMKLDSIVFHDPTHATVIDYKTGRKFGNEIKHNEQLRFYTLGALMRYPKLQKVTAELWYLDQKDITSVTMTRLQGLAFRQNFDGRIKKLVTAADFPPNPNKFSCRWCQYGPWNGGQCQKGMQ